MLHIKYGVKYFQQKDLIVTTLLTLSQYNPEYLNLTSSQFDIIMLNTIIIHWLVEVQFSTANKSFWHLHNTLGHTKLNSIKILKED